MNSRFTSAKSGTPAARRTPNYLVAHWRGLLPLALTFWGNWVGVSLVLGLWLGWLMARIDVGAGSVGSSSLAVLIGWLASLVLGVWGAVGTWRASGAVGREARSPLRHWAGKAGVVAGVLLTLLATLETFAPRAAEYLQLARGIDPAGHLEASVSADGQRVRLRGPIGVGDAARVQSVLAQATAAGLIEIESPGGRLGEAQRIASAVKARPWQVRATGACDNACALILLAGTRRQLSPQGQLGFHRMPDEAYIGVFRAVAHRQQQVAYARAGLPEEFVARVMSTAPTVSWHPRANELVSVGLVTAGERPLDVDLPVSRAAAATDYVEALRTNPIWDALERRYPGSIQAAAERIQAARAAGANDGASQLEGQRVVQALVPTLLADVSPETRILYLELLAQQLAAARTLGAQACRDVLLADVGVRAQLPAALAWSEATWLADAAGEREQGVVRHRPSEVELEVMRHALGSRALAQLPTLRQPGSAPARDGDCDAPSALVDTVLHLALPERRLAARLAFDPLASR